MFYILNFQTHSFSSFDSAEKAEEAICNSLAFASEDNLEIINGHAEGSRLSVSEFRTMCSELALIPSQS